MSRSYRIRISEGQFGQNFGPNFDIVAGGGVGVPLGLVLALSRKRKKKRLTNTSLTRIVRLIRLLGSLEKIPVGSAA